MRTRWHPPTPTREIRIEKPLRSCIERIAVRCSLDCCGTDACSATPVLLELWSSSVGKDKTRSAIDQALDIVRLCDSSEPLSCDFLNYRELCAAASAVDTARDENERVQGEHRRRLRDFFASLAAGLNAYA
jgi:hypothetical protein